jgi:hypothetical protein
MATDSILVGRLHLVGEIIDEDAVGEAELAEQLVPGGVRAGQLLVGLLEVGLQGIDGFQPRQDAAGIDVGWDSRPARERLDQRWRVGRNLMVSPSGSGPCRGRSG